MTTIVHLQKLMRVLPKFLEQHFIDNDLYYTKADMIPILCCFNNGAIIDETSDNFEDFYFRRGDIVLLLQMAEYIRGNEHIFEDCNPNAMLPTVSTIIGHFYSYTETEIIDIQGMSVIKFK